jgi:hypothetical protein
MAKRPVSLAAGDRIPPLVAVAPADVSAGARIWGYQEPGGEPTLFAGPCLCPDGSKVDSSDPSIVFLGKLFGDADADALILVEELGSPHG